MLRHRRTQTLILALFMVGTIGLISPRQATCCCEEICGPEYEQVSPSTCCPGQLVHHTVMRDCQCVVTADPCTRTACTKIVREYDTICTSADWSACSGSGGGGGGGPDGDDHCPPGTCCFGSGGMSD